MVVDYRKFNHLLICMEITVPDVVMLHGKINTSSGACYTAIDLANTFFSGHVLAMIIRSCTSTASEASNTHSLSYLRGITTLQPYAII